MSETSSDVENETMQDKLTGLKYPRHILDKEAEPLCGIELAERHYRMFEKLEPEDFRTVEEHLEEYKLSAVDDFCGNCLRAYLSRNEGTELHDAYERYQEMFKTVEEVPEV